MKFDAALVDKTIALCEKKNLIIMTFVFFFSVIFLLKAIFILLAMARSDN